MTHQSLELAGLSVKVVGSGETNVVLMHGFGAPGDDLVPLAQCFDDLPGLSFVFPVGPLKLPPLFGGGRAWWHIDFAARAELLSEGIFDFSREEPEGIGEARDQLDQFLDELCARQPGRLILGGFSQGSMLALDLALRTDRELAGLVVMSGTLLCAHVWVPLMTRRCGLPVFHTHGRADPLLPFSGAEALNRHMQAAGMRVTWHPSDSGHDIGPEALDELGRFIARCSTP